MKHDQLSKREMTSIFIYLFVVSAKRIMKHFVSCYIIEYNNDHG
jgi:hypothetical protein